LGDATKARQKLGWEPKHSLEDLVKDMMIEDLAEAERESHLVRNGYAVHQPRE